MKNRIYALSLFIGMLLSVATANAKSANTLSALVVPIAENTWNAPPLQGQFADEVRFMIQQNNKYTLNKWYCDAKQYQQQTETYIDFGGTTEHFIRPAAHNAFTLAVSLRLHVYDASVTNVSEKQARAVTLRLIRSLAYRHKSNSPEGGWGDQWQSALWASQVAQAAWLIWDKLPDRDRELVSRMVVHEADRFNNYTVPYYRDLEGNILSKGDTKAEENAWNSNILAIATAMMPAHKHYDRWMQKLIELQLSAHATPEDTKNTTRVDGIPMNQLLKGSNLNSDGTVVNHDIIHPDYMSTFMHNIINGWMYKLAGKDLLESSLYNGDLVYYALSQQQYDGKTMYVTTQNGKASSELYFPQGNDWGGKRQANYWLMDVIAHLYGWDRDASVKAINWAAVRNTEMLAMLNRDTTGQYYQAQSEDKFPSREAWFGSHIAWGYLGLWLYQNAPSVTK